MINKYDYGLLEALKHARRSFVITDPTLPDNPIVFASGMVAASELYDPREGRRGVVAAAVRRPDAIDATHAPQHTIDPEYCDATDASPPECPWRQVLAGSRRRRAWPRASVARGALRTTHASTPSRQRARATTRNKQ